MRSPNDDTERIGDDASCSSVFTRSALKPFVGSNSASARRRSNALERMKTNRQDALSYARSVVIAIASAKDDGHSSFVSRDDAFGRHPGAKANMDVVVDGDANDANDAKDANDVAPSTSGERALTQPEWMWDDVPSDLNSKWLVRARPRGERVLVVSSRGKTTARGRDGGTFATFQSALPGGSARTMRGRASDCFCILDCVYAVRENVGAEDADAMDVAVANGGRGTYYVLDVMAWNGAAVYDCDAEFRFFWAHTRLTQECEACERLAGSKTNEFSFASTPWYRADADGVRLAYAENIGVERDGLLFYHKEAHYDVGMTPLVLRWRDASTSAFYLRDEGADDVLARAGVVVTESDPPPQVIALKKSIDGAFFVTGDDPAVVIAACDATPRATPSAPSHVDLAPGRVGRFVVGAGGFVADAATGTVRSADIAYLGPKPRVKTHHRHGRLSAPSSGENAEVLSKILFHARARTPAALTIHRLLDVAASNV